MHDLSVIIVSKDDGHWLDACLRSVYEHAGGLSLDVVVVDNDSQDDTAELVRERWPAARVVGSPNHGFAHGNNRGLVTCDSRYVLFLNPDTEVLEGDLGDLLRRLDAAPEVGLAGCVQVAPDGKPWPTMRRFPNALNSLAEAFGAGRARRSPAWAATCERDMMRYDEEFDLDWTSGSFMLVRREALESAGWLDERFFLYSEEIDLARRIRSAGWKVRHLPHLRILHHFDKAGFNPRRQAQYAYAKRLYAEKHFSPVHRMLFLGGFGLRFALRLALYRLVHPGDRDATAAMARALRTLAGLEGPPYAAAPPTAVRPFSGNGTARGRRN